MPYTMPNKLLEGSSVTLGASETDTQVSEIIRVGIYDRDRIVVDIVASSTTVSTGITAKIQDRANGSESWEDKKTVSITGDDLFSISLNPEVSGDQASLPLRPQMRVVVSTGAGDAATIDKVYVSRARD